jgi:hypothetical protein
MNKNHMLTLILLWDCLSFDLDQCTDFEEGRSIGLLWILMCAHLSSWVAESMGSGTLNQVLGKDVKLIHLIAPSTTSMKPRWASKEGSRIQSQTARKLRHEELYAGPPYRVLKTMSLFLFMPF